MGKQIDVTGLPDSMIHGIEQVIRAYRERGNGSNGASGRASQRPHGWLKGRWEVPSTFFDSLPQDVVDRFEGRSESD